MCGLPFDIEWRSNAEYMSPSGQVPFIKCGAFVISEFNPIVEFVGKKGIFLNRKLDESASDINTYLDMIDKVLSNAEYYVCWFHHDSVRAHTWPRYSSPHPWPLDTILFYSKKQAIKKKLKTSPMYNMTIDQVLDQVDDCLQALSNLLQDNRKFFYGRKPTELDALVFGHVSALSATNLVNNRLQNMVANYPNLLQFYQKVKETYFQTWSSNVM